ncbi:MAG: substrate-binding domain-containing protein [Deltaproteobacteria bacterium]|nr:substrate-binding domain-containing protein [Deltaproteobacteria bacterium]
MSRKSSFFLVFLLSLLVHGSWGWAGLRVVGSDSNLELMANLVIAFGAKTGISVDLRGPGSLEGLHQLMQGKAEIAFISRQLSRKEKSSGLVGVPYCRDAVAVVVHPANPVRNLTKGELREIFTGEKASWKDGTRVVVLIRDGFSGTRQLFQERIMGGAAFAPADLHVEKRGKGVIFSPIFSTFHPPFFPLVKRQEEMLFLLSKIRGAIAYVSVGAIPKECHLVSINGVLPTRENIRKGSYLLSRTPTLVTLGPPGNEAVRLIGFIVGKEGQRIVERMGYIPIAD